MSSARTASVRSTHSYGHCAELSSFCHSTHRQCHCHCARCSSRSRLRAPSRYANAPALHEGLPRQPRQSTLQVNTSGACRQAVNPQEPNMKPEPAEEKPCRKNNAWVAPSCTASSSWCSTPRSCIGCLSMCFSFTKSASLSPLFRLLPSLAHARRLAHATRAKRSALPTRGSRAHTVSTRL